MSASWREIEEVLRRHAAPVAQTLRPGASLDQIRAAQHAIGVTFPQDVQDAYLQHDGCEPGPELFPVGWWCSLEEMVRKWDSMLSTTNDLKANGEFHIPDPKEFPWDALAVRPEWWCDQWVPVAVTNTVTAAYIDLLPAPGGTKGQLIADSGMGEAYVLASSLTSYLTTMVTRYQQGRIVYDDGMKTASGALITYWNDLERNG